MSLSGSGAAGAEAEAAAPTWSVRFRGHMHVVAARGLAELQAQLAELTGVAAEHQKLVGRGARVLNLAALQACAGATLQLLGSSAAEVEQAAAGRALPVLDDLDVDYEAVARERERAAKEREHEHRLREAGSTPYRFMGVRELPQFRDSAVAKRLLEELASNPGFLAVMRKHNWTVGVLSEMYPDGKVGVDPVCVLGVNINKGQEISLRLRTDDLQGFTKIAMIRETLAHELAHMVHSEHDGDFYQLMRQIQSEVVELDWRQGEGRRLGGEAFLTSAVLAHAPRVGGTTTGGAYVLGRASPSMGDNVAAAGSSDGSGSGGDEGGKGSAGERAARAAERRLADDAAQPKARCACGRSHSPRTHRAEAAPAVADSDVVMQAPAKEQIAVPPSPPPALAPSEPPSDNGARPPTCDVDMQLPPRDDDHSDDFHDDFHHGEQRPAASAPSGASAEPANEPRSLATVSDAVAAAIQRAVGDVVERNPAARALSALGLVATVLANALAHPAEDKYRSLRQNNPKVRALLSEALGARALLTALGFTALDDTLVLVDDSACELGLQSVREAQQVVASLL
jgi:hypothetical protein